MNIRKFVLGWLMLLLVAIVCFPASGSGNSLSGQVVRLTVTGRIDSANNNCDCWVGFGGAPGEGVLIQFGFYGGGCSTYGYNVNARGVVLDAQEYLCVFTGNWLWIQSGQFYTATLTIDGSSAELSVPGVGVSSGSLAWQGEASVLYIGRQGDQDWTSCSGAIDLVTIEAKESSGDWYVVDTEDFSTDEGFTSTDPDLFISGGMANWTIQRNEGSQFLYRNLASPIVSDDIQSWGGIKALYK